MMTPCVFGPSLAKPLMEFLLRSNNRPDVIHCHDWQTGLIPVMLFEIYKYNGMEVPADAVQQFIISSTPGVWRH